MSMFSGAKARPTPKTSVALLRAFKWRSRVRPSPANRQPADLLRGRTSPAGAAAHKPWAADAVEGGGEAGEAARARGAIGGGGERGGGGGQKRDRGATARGPCPTLPPPPSPPRRRIAAVDFWGKSSSILILLNPHQIQADLPRPKTEASDSEA